MDGKVALVTGAAQGIGYAMSEELLKKGAKVSIVDFDEGVGEKAVAALNNTYGHEKCIFSKCDVTCLADLEASFAKTKAAFGRIDIVCNNAGISNEEKWEHMVDINFKGVVYGSQLAIEYMSKDKGGNGGTVMNTASMAGLFPLATIPVYCGTKYAVVGYTRSLAAHPLLEQNGLKFVALCPGIAQTPLGRDIYDRTDGLPQAERDALKNHLGQESEWLSPKDIAVDSMMLLAPDAENGYVLSVSKEFGTELQSFD